MLESIYQANENGEIRYLEYQIVRDDYSFYLYKNRRKLAVINHTNGKIAFMTITQSERLHVVIQTFLTAVIQFLLQRKVK